MRCALLARQGLTAGASIFWILNLHAQDLRYLRNSEERVASALPAGSGSAPTNLPALPPHPVSTVQVDAREDFLRSGLPAPHSISEQQVLSSAGTWGDFSRYLQLLPGVVWNNDFSNEIMVRGGNPAENLFVVDGIEIPNINHFALEGTTGGFASMLDTSVIENVELTPGNYSPGYSKRLSALVEIHTRDGMNKPPVRELDLGIAGAGGLIQQMVGRRASLLLSAHRSVLNLATNDIGVNGVPIYTNGFAQSDIAVGEKDRLSLLNLSGADSITMTPQPCDPGVTSPIRTGYAGLRSTTGMVWQHVLDSRSNVAGTLSYSSQDQNIGQQWQTVLNSSCTEIGTTPVYTEQTHDGIASLSLQINLQRGAWLYSAGALARLTQLKYQVAQPLGSPSPFRKDPTWTDADSFRRNFSTGQTAAFAEATGAVAKRWTVVLAGREEAFALTGSQFLSSRASIAYRLSERQTLNASFGRTAQLPPTINILSYPQNERLEPIEAVQASVAADLWRGDHVRLGVEAFQKEYSREPVSTEYPSLMLANMVDTLGQEFDWLPLRSTGIGRAEGLEVSLTAHGGSRFRVTNSFTYSRTRYAASDRVMRPGNFDFPLVANVLGNMRLFWKIDLSVRNSYASGRPYTPFDLPLSEAQSRGIYDLTRVNGVRAPAYNRLDADINRDIHVRGGLLNIHAGVENALNRDNFLGFVWMNSCHPQPTDTHCARIPMAIPGVPETQVSQMKLFPSAWVHYTF